MSLSRLKWHWMHHLVINGSFFEFLSYLKPTFVYRIQQTHFCTKVCTLKDALALRCNKWNIQIQKVATKRQDSSCQHGKRQIHRINVGADLESITYDKEDVWFVEQAKQHHRVHNPAKMFMNCGPNKSLWLEANARSAVKACKTTEHSANV